MALQDFLSGGFIGKLGDVVGQHWHNKRFVRQWVNTPNPDTPAQRSHRQKFALGSHLGNLWMQYTGHYGIYDTSEMGEFPIRTSKGIHFVDAVDKTQPQETFCPLVNFSVDIGQGRIEVEHDDQNSYLELWGVPVLPLNWKLVLFGFADNFQYFAGETQTRITISSTISSFRFPGIFPDDTKYYLYFAFVGALAPSDPRPAWYSNTRAFTLQP